MHAQVERGRGGRQVGAVAGQRRDDGGAVGGRGEHRRGQPASRLAGVDVGAARQEQFHRAEVARRGREHQRGGAVVGLGGRIGPAFEQRLDDAAVAELGGQQQRRVGADAGRRPRVGAGLQQHRGQGRLVVHRRPVQGRHPVALRRVDVGTLGEERLDGGGVAARGGIGHRRVDRGRHRRGGEESAESGGAERRAERGSRHGSTLAPLRPWSRRRPPNPAAPCCRRSWSCRRSRASASPTAWRWPSACRRRWRCAGRP